MTGIISPLMMERFIIWRFTISSASPPNCMDVPSGGARTILFAILTSAFFILTWSPIPAPEFCLIKPSMRIISWSQSIRSARQTFADVALFPSSSIMSPGVSCRIIIVCGSSRAIPLPESFGYAFATVSVISSIVISPQIY